MPATTSSFHIRPATSADAHIVSGFVEALIVELSGRSVGVDKRLPVATSLLCEDTTYRGFLAFQQETPVGVLMLSEFSAIYTLGVAATITELYVVPSHRSYGVARQLLNTAVGHGVQRGWKRLEVSAPSQPRWERTLRFYQRNGFVEVGPRLHMKLP